MAATITLANGVAFQALERKTILDSATAAGVALEYSCRNGRCGVCKANAIGGETEALRPEICLTLAEAAGGAILTCCRTPLSDVALDINDISALAGIEVRTAVCKIDRLDLITSTVLRVVLRTPPAARLAFLPGQHLDIIHGQTRRAYSIANAPRADGRLELLVARVDGGVMSRYWFEKAQVNDVLRLEGPLGTFFLREDGASRVILLATGTGIAPIKAMAEQIHGNAENPRADIFWGTRSEEDIYLERLPLPPGVGVVTCLSRPQPGWNGGRGYVQNVFAAQAQNLPGCSVYACGSPDMIETARQLLVEQGLPRRRFYSDAFVQS